MGTTTAERYRSAYSKPIRIHTATGNGMQDEYGYELNKKGIRELVKTGEKNLYAEIQSYAEEVKIENILKPSFFPISAISLPMPRRFSDIRKPFSGRAS